MGEKPVSYTHLDVYKRQFLDFVATMNAAAGAAPAVNLSTHWYLSLIHIFISEFGRTFRENGNKGTDHGHGTVYWAVSYTHLEVFPSIVEW